LICRLIDGKEASVPSESDISWGCFFFEGGPVLYLAAL
jgi:hypothetical protein